MNTKTIFPGTYSVLRFVLTAIITLGVVAGGVATASADAPAKHTKKEKVRFVKKYVRVTGSNIPVPVWVAEGPLPQTTFPIRSYTADEMRKMGAQTPAQGLANDPSVFINNR
jgi:hypothetical protein